MEVKDKQAESKIEIPKVSVIIPVYGVEKYIEKCARSLFEQTLDSIEYLFIDDCTPDKSIEILNTVLEEYPFRKNQVVIHQMEHNSGQAAVRKWGALNATGEYFIYCDSDDWVELNMYESLYNKAKNESAEIVICDMFENIGDDEIYKNTVSDKVHTVEDYRVGVITRDVHCSSVNKLINKKLYKNELTFPTENYGEDSALIIQLFYYAKKIDYLHKAFYHYRYNPSSITKQEDKDATIRSFFQTCKNAQLVDDFYKGKNNDRRVVYAIQYLKCMERDRLLPLTKNCEYFRIWISMFREINNKILVNPIIPFKIKLRYVTVRLHIYPLINNLLHVLRFSSSFSVV